MLYTNAYDRSALQAPKRGASIGSGIGKKRKAEHEYSTNKATKRTNERNAKMTSEQANLRRAKAADAKAMSRALEKRRANDPDFSALEVADQKAALKDEVELAR